MFSFTTKDCTKQDRKDLVFRGAFFWSMPDADFKIVEEVWDDTKDRILSEDFDHFVRISDGRISHIRPHGRDSEDTLEYKGHSLIKRCFWLNDLYIKSVIDENLNRQSKL